MIDKSICVLCQGNDSSSSLVHEKLRYGHPGKIYRCSDCGLVFLYPRLTEDEQKKYYAQQYRDDYEEISVEKRFSNDMAEAEKRLLRIKDIAPPSGSLLEIGSGSGAFLYLSSQYFNMVSGVELDVRAQEFLRKKSLNIYSDLNEISGKKFDVIVLFHVLEHLLEPVKFIQMLGQFLNENGKLIIEVPNVNDALVKFYDINAFKDFYFCSAHLCYFSPKTLKFCLKQAGFS